MSLLLYAITTPPRSELAEPLIRVAAGKLTAWATGTDAQSFGREDALRHHGVICTIFESVEACLPARFPTLLADADALKADLLAREDAFIQQLDEVRGTCELAVTAVWTTPEEPSPRVEATTPGRRYLLERQAALTASELRHATATELAEHLEREAGDALRAAERRITPSKGVALSLALLVDRHAADAVRERLGHYVNRDLRILVHGPWPPYTFAGRARSVEA